MRAKWIGKDLTEKYDNTEFTWLQNHIYDIQTNLDFQKGCHLHDNYREMYVTPVIVVELLHYGQTAYRRYVNVEDMLIEWKIAESNLDLTSLKL